MLTSIKWRSLQSHARSTPWVMPLMLTGAAFLLAWIALGSVPLRDWDEGTYATVARTIHRSGNWLYPTLHGGPFVVYKPPLLEWLMALTYQIGGVTEWTSRLAPAGLSALCVPLLYWIGREVFPTRTPAIFSAWVYLTFLPVARHGRLAMRDGMTITFLLFLLLCLLKARRDRRWALGVGLALGLTTLTKGVLMLLWVGIAGLFLLVNRQYRLLISPYLWGGIFLGMAPAIAWYWAQGQHFGVAVLQAHFFGQSLDRLWDAVESNQGPVWYYLLELLKYGWPWLLFWPGSLWLAWQQRSQAWAQLALVGTVSYLGVISLMGTKLPWYLMPLYPFLALTLGAYLAQIWQHGKPYRAFWGWFLGLIAVVALVGGPYWSWADRQPMLFPTSLLLSLTLGLTAWRILQRDRRFIPILLGGLYCTLLMMMVSPFWLWELNEAYPVKPVAALIQTQTPGDARVYTTFPYHRPSLDFYSDRQVVPITPDQIAQQWTPNTYFLLEKNLADSLPLPNAQVIGVVEDFALITPKP